MHGAGRLGLRLAGARLLLLGAGGAARGVIRPLLDAGVMELVIANRTVAKARALATMAHDRRVRATGLDALGALQAEVVVNATSAGLAGEAAAPVDAAAFGSARLAYDMVYGPGLTAFLRRALDCGCAKASDGLGMLVEQAAESFLLWRGVRPDTRPVFAALRASIDQAAEPR